MKNKIIMFIAAIAACVGVANAYEPCGVYEEVIQPCAPIEAVEPCAPIQACAPVETTIEPCAPVEACAPVAECAECVGVKTVACEECYCRGVKIAFRPGIVERVRAEVAQKKCCVARIFARKKVSIERKVKIETN